MKLKFTFNPRTRQAVVESDGLKQIREVLSVKNDAARFAQQKGMFHIPDRKYCITPTGRFDLGLYEEIIKAAKTLGCGVEIEHDTAILSALQPVIQYDCIARLKLPLRDYQEEIVETSLKRGWGTVVLATAGGKTLIMASLISTYLNTDTSKKVLIIVPDIGLATQTYKDFIEYGIDESVLTRWTGSLEPNKSANIIIANLGILQSDTQDPTWLYGVDMLICDETHKLRASNKVNDLIKKIKTVNRFGFTGTMPEDKLDYWNVVGKMGPVIFEKNSAALREEKYITPVTVNVLRIDYTEAPDYSGCSRDPVARYEAEKEFITKNTYRNNVLAKLAGGLRNNTLIMVDRIEHGEELEKHFIEYFKDNNIDKKIYWIRGEVEVEEREKLRQKMEVSYDIVCIAISAIFSTGVNIKNLHNIIFASGGKAKVKIVQSIGRGLRKHESKEELTIIDIGDQLKYGRAHLEKRLQLYDNESIPYTFKDLKQP